MDAKEIRTRLLVAASDLPGVRAGIHSEQQALDAVRVAQVWYNFVMEPSPQGGKRPTLGLKKGVRGAT